MFCRNCGEQLSEGTKFCQKCGAKTVLDDVAQKSSGSSHMSDKVEQSFSTVAEVESAKNQLYANSMEEHGRKKLKKLPIIFGVTVLMIIIVFIIIINWEGKIDYVATVKAFTPFAVSQGLPYTYEEVLNQYIDSLEWEVREEGKTHYVDISGIVKGMDIKFALTISVSADPNDKNIVNMKPKSGRMGDERFTTEEDVVRALFNLFYLYDEGNEIGLTKTYINEGEGFSFKYPSTWIDAMKYHTEDEMENYLVSLANMAEDYPELSSVVEIRKFSNRQDMINMLLINDEEFIKIFCEGENVISPIETSVVELDGIPARMISYINGEIFFQTYIYSIGGDLYWIDFICKEGWEKSVEWLFEAIIESYTIDYSMGSSFFDYNVNDDILGTENDYGLSNFSYNTLSFYSGYYEGNYETSISVSIYSSFSEENIVGNVFLYDSLGHETYASIRDDNEGEGIYTLCLEDSRIMYIGFYQDYGGEYCADILGLDAIYTNVNEVETYIMTEQYIP